MRHLRKKSFILIIMFGLLMLTACNHKTNSNQNNEENVENNNQEESENVEENNHQEDDEENLEQAESEGVDGSNDLDGDEITEEFETMTFSVLENDEKTGTFEVDLTNPDESYEINDDLKVDLLKYFPDYVMVDEEPTSQSDMPLNPAFIFNVVKDEMSESIFLGIGTNVTNEEDPIFNIQLIDYTYQD
ncbi:MAG TPA: hypothetical protein VK111_10790 [Virgibacillus sp.]|nr:hypothetical protein [Virgibacillus sp.]